MDEKLKELLDRAREGGASAEQLREIIRTYKSNNATSPKGEVAEGENGGLESPSADTASSSDSPQQYRLATPEELDDYIASGGIITESQQMKDQKKVLEEYEKQVKAKEREAMGKAVQDVINRNKFPELMEERDSLVKQMESMPIMATGELDARVKEIDEIINAKPKSYRKIRQERLDELNSLIAEQEQKDYRLGANGAYLENNGTYEQLQKERKQVKADVDSQTALLDKLRDDTTITDQFIRFYTPKFLEKYVTPENEQVKLSDEVEEKLLLKLDSDKRLKSKVDMGGKDRTYISLAERENLIKQAKEEVLVEKGKEIKEEYDAIIEKSKGLDQEKDAKELFKLQKQIDLLNERNDELLFTYGYDKVNNQFNDVFKRTTRSKDYDESLGQGGADVGSTFVEGLANVVLDGTVGFAGWLGSLGDAFTDDDSYSIFDAVGDTAYELSNNNLLPSSKSEQGSLVDKDGNWNVSLYSVGKAGAEGLPFTLALINDARKGNVRNMYKKLGGIVSPKKMKTISQSLQMAEKAYKITVSDNRKEAFDNGLDGTQAIAYSNFQSMATGLTQMIMPDTKFFKTPAGKVVLNKFANDLKGAATREAIKKASLNFLGNLGKEIGEEELEGAISEIIKFGMLQNHSSEFLTAKYQKELIGNTLVVSGALGGAGFKSNVEANKTKLYRELNTNYEGLISDIDNMIDSSNDEKFIEMLNTSKKLIGDVKEATNKSPKDVSGKQIDLLIEKKELIQEMKSMDDSFHPEYKEKIEKINENIRKEASLKESEAVNDTNKTKTETKQGESKTESEKKVGYNVSEQLKSHNENEGSTFTLDGKNRSGEKGVSSVSIFPERSKIIDGEITEQDISEFKEANKDLLEGNEDVLAIGTWFDKKSGKTYLDVSAVTDTDSAIKLGEQYNQKAVFNLETFEEIDTKGDGTPIKNLKSEVDRVSDIRSISKEFSKDSKTGKGTQQFFGDVVSGKSDKYIPSKNYEYESNFNSEQEQFRKSFDEKKGNFDEHIATSIPTFRDTQVKKGNAIVQTYGNQPNGALVYDLGGSEGGFVKTITEQSNGNIKTINLDPNPEMQESFNKNKPEGSEMILEAFGKGWEGVPTHKPKQKADVVHESMMFQFIEDGGERKSKIKEVSDNYLKPNGVFITEQKFKGDKNYNQNEKIKNTTHKNKYYTQEQINAKGEEVLVGMSENQTNINEYIKELKKHFEYVDIYWKAGNFSGIIASNNKQKFDTMLKNIGDTSNNYTYNESNKKSTEVQATTEGTRANKTGTDKSVDGNVQSDIKEDKEIKPVLAAVRAMVSVSEKAESLRELKAKLKDLTSSGMLTKFQSKSLINRALKVDPTNKKQVDNFVEYFGKQMGKATTRANKNKYGSKLKGIVKKAIKVQKKKIGHIGQNILELSRIRPESIPEEHIENYYNVMEAVSKNKYVKEDVDALYADLKEAIIKDVEARNEEREANRSKDPKDTSELIVEAKKAISKSYDTSLLNDSEKTILKKLKGLGSEYIEQLSAKKLRQIANDLEILSEYGYLPNKNISSIVTFSEGVEIANEIKGKVGDKLLHVSSGLVQEINRIFGKKEQSVKTMIQRFQNKMGQHTDALIKGVKGTDFYTNIVHPISAGLQTATEKTLETGGKLELLIKKAKIKDKFDFNVKLQLLFRQLEYNNNPTFKGKKVFKVSDHIKATQELFDKGKSQYSEESVNTINKLYNEYKNEDGEIDVDKLEKSLSPAEKKIIDFIKKHLSETANKRRDLDSNLLGENTLLLEEYFPRQNDSGVKQKGGYMDYIKQVFNSSSVKPQAAKERKVNGANALDFTTLSHFMSHIKDSNVESHISPSMKRVGIVLSQLQDSDNKSLVKVAMALEKSVNKLVDVHMGKNIYAAKSKNDKLIQTLLSKTFNKMLMSNTRAVIDNISQNATLFLLNADRIGAIRKSREKMKGISKSIMDDYSSTQRERIGGNRAVDFQEGISTDLTKAKWSKKDPSKRDKAIDLLNKNKVSELGDRYAKAYYQVVDFSAKFFWDFHFLNNFEKTTGEAFNADKYKKDADYKIKFDKAIRQSVANTDKQISNIYNTGAQSEQKLKVQIGSKNRDFKTRINSFMQSFSFNENSVWWDSLMSMMGKEGGTIESQQEAFRTFMTVNIRSMTYGYLSMTLFNSFAAALGLLDDDDELEEKAIKRTLAQHGMLIAFGNKGSIFNMGAAYIFENWIHKNMVKSQGGKYNGYEDSLLYAQQERGTLKSHLGTLGAEGQLMQNVMDVGELVTKMMMEYDKTGSISEDKLVDFKAAKIGITTLAQLTGLPIDRLGKQWQNMMSDDLKQRKEAVKKKEKKKKSKKSAFAF